MAEEIKSKFTGEWLLIQDDHMPSFLDTVGATDEEKNFMLSSTPKLTFSVNGNTIKSCTIPNPETKPEITADVEFKLDEEFTIQPGVHLLQIKVQWGDGKMTQNVTPIQGHSAAHIIELHIDDEGDLIQTYKTTNTEGNEVKGTRRYKKIS